jgi:uncharacterized protein YozE (UPF0346 family)
MNIDFSGIAYAIRSNTAASATPIKLSQAQQCTAAALGYNSLAAWQASRDANQALHQGSHVVLDTTTLLRRATGLQMPHKSQDLIAILDEAFTKKLPGIGIHDSLDDFEDALRNLVQDAVLNDGNTAGQMAVTNNDGIREIYLPFDIEWNDLPVAGDDVGDGLAITIEGHIAMEVDLERPYSGHRIDVGARLWLARQARSIFNVTCHVEHAQLDWGDDDEDRDDRPPKVSLAEALADELGLEFYEADQLVEAHVQEIEGHEGMLYGYTFDFSDIGADESVLEKIEQRYGSLNVRVSLNFFDNIHGRDANPRRHYVHGDQVEGSQDHYYCAHCDMFVASDHFEGEHPGASEGRYFSSLNAWQRTPAENKINARRPVSAMNILAATALASRKNREAARGDFHRWLEQQVGRNDPVGDLAQDVAHDVGFPASAKSKKIISSYLAGAQASGSAIEAFEAAWKEFALSGK